MLIAIIIYLIFALPGFSIWYDGVSVKSTPSVIRVTLANALTNTLIYLIPFIESIMKGRERETFLYGAVLFAYTAFLTASPKIILNKKSKREQHTPAH